MVRKGKENFFTNPNYRPEEMRPDYVGERDTIPALEASEKIYRKIFQLAERVSELEKAAEVSSETIRSTISERFSDSLTTCLNRNYLNLYKERIFNSEKDDNQVGVIFFDVNGLKAVNDKEGHEAGDCLIVAISRHLQNSFDPANNTKEFLSNIADYIIKTSDKESSPDDKKVSEEVLRDFINKHNSVIRLGGDEFLVICSNSKNSETFESDLREKLEQTVESSPSSIASGLAMYSSKTDQSDISQTMKRADDIMYETKRAQKSGQTPPNNPKIQS